MQPWFGSSRGSRRAEVSILFPGETGAFELMVMIFACKLRVNDLVRRAEIENGKGLNTQLYHLDSAVIYFYLVVNDVV